LLGALGDEDYEGPAIEGADAVVVHSSTPRQSEDAVAGGADGGVDGAGVTQSLITSENGSRARDPAIDSLTVDRPEPHAADGRAAHRLLFGPGRIGHRTPRLAVRTRKLAPTVYRSHLHRSRVAFSRIVSTPY